MYISSAIKYGMPWSEYVTSPNYSLGQNHRNVLIYLKNLYECVIINYFEHYNVKIESLEMSYWSILKCQ